ncbi:GAF and ANTAR domain-containing protein [Nocardioides pocheonensis]|uniref:ANTAR domain-containing protein n=1 Tax=Nocardioides pocheonensis TaxID=661485 RepID=A0A3N0GNI1_9ACTN|nr:GAF and ANTAR domain-containing protein [Nocardioides pocheonensis]RNM14033.1 ANTAR domain-containing protein [Nocardioides pocheonensis]
MYDRELFLQTLASSTLQQLVTPFDAQTSLDELALRVTDVLGLSGSAVSLVHGDRLVLQTAHDSGIASVGRAQEQSQSGPCVMAWRSGDVVTVAELAEERSRWPVYCETAAKVGITAVASVPMKLGAEAIGVLGLYSRESRDWPDEDLAAASMMAELTTAFLVHDAHVREQVEHIEQLQRALTSRVSIEQGKGFLAGSRGISIDEAFETLRRYARSHHTTLAETAEAVVRGLLEP